MTIVGVALFAFGIAIGITGIGGVAVVPLLVALAGWPVDAAVPIAMAAFVATGCVGAVAHRNALPEARHITVALVVFATLGAAVGAFAFPYITGFWIEIALGSLMVLVGSLQLLPSLSAMTATEESPLSLGFVGFAVGFGSSITGTGGPVLFVPWMLALGVHVRAVVALAQIVQVPIAVAASTVYLARGSLELELAIMVSILLALGAGCGGILSSRLQTVLIRSVVAYALVAGGVVYLLLRLSPFWAP